MLTIKNRKGYIFYFFLQRKFVVVIFEIVEILKDVKLAFKIAVKMEVKLKLKSWEELKLWNVINWAASVDCSVITESRYIGSSRVTSVKMACEVAWGGSRIVFSWNVEVKAVKMSVEVEATVA